MRSPWELKRHFFYLILLALALAPFSSRAADMSAEDKEKIDQALPAKAPASPGVASVKLLVLNFNRVHVAGAPVVIKPSIPHGNYAIEAIGKKTGAYTTVLSTHIEALRPENLKQYDALEFNNTTGVLTTGFTLLRDSLLAFVAEGKGFVSIREAPSPLSRALFMTSSRLSARWWAATRAAVTLGTRKIPSTSGSRIPRTPSTRCSRGKEFPDPGAGHDRWGD